MKEEKELVKVIAKMADAIRATRDASRLKIPIRKKERPSRST